jgi:hypothetical protein
VETEHGLILVEPMMRAALTGTLGRVRRFALLLRRLIGGMRELNRLGLHRRALEPLDLMALDQTFRARLASPGGRAELARLADADIRTIAAAHWIPTERPREMQEAIETWLARVGL